MLHERFTVAQPVLQRERQAVCRQAPGQLVGGSLRLPRLDQHQGKANRPAIGRVGNRLHGVGALVPLRAGDTNAVGPERFQTLGPGAQQGHPHTGGRQPGRK